MANRLYDKGREGFGNGDISWRDGDIRAIIIDTLTYTPNFVSDEFLDDISPSAIVAMSSALTGKTNVGGVMDSDDVTFATIPSGPPCEAIILVQYTGDEATSRLICYLDTATNLPFTPAGVPVVIQWNHSDPNRIFKL